VNRRIISRNKTDLLHHPDEQTIPPQRLTDKAGKVNGILPINVGKGIGVKSLRMVDEPKSDQQTLIKDRQ